MILFYIIIFVVALVGIKVRKTAVDREAYLSKDSTNAIKGIFIMTVFLRHANQYVNESGYDYSQIWDKLFVVINGLSGQLIVVMFLFFSGYGVMLSVKKKGNAYINSIPKHRALNTLLNFDVAVLFFLVLALIIGRPLSWSQVLLSFLAWESIGNSTWYIFIIIVCYLSTWLSFASLKFIGDKKKYLTGGAIVNSIVLLIIGLLLYKVDKPWYDTMICYPLGMMFALFKDEIEHFTSKHWGYAICLFVGIALFILSYACPFMDDPQQIYWEGCGWIWWNIRIISMIAIIVLLMMNLKIGNSFLIWMGVNLFPLYIYQRIPMIIISTYFTCNPFILFTASFALTCALVPLYKKIQIQL